MFVCVQLNLLCSFSFIHVYWKITTISWCSYFNFQSIVLFDTKLKQKNYKFKYLFYFIVRCVFFLFFILKQKRILHTVHDVPNTDGAFQLLKCFIIYIHVLRYLKLHLILYLENWIRLMLFSIGPLLNHAKAFVNEINEVGLTDSLTRSLWRIC